MRLRPDVVVLVGLDLVLLGVAWWAAFWLRFNLDIPAEFVDLAWSSGIWMLLAYSAGLTLARVYRQVWRYTGLPELRQLVWGVLLGSLASAALLLMLRFPNFPRSVLLLQPFLALVLLSAVRAGWRMLREQQAGSGLVHGRPLLVVGRLQDATEALRALRGSIQWRPVGIVSPLIGEQGRSVQSVPVLGRPADLALLASLTGARTALVASPPGSAERRELLLQTPQAGLSLLTMPRPDEWLNTETSGPRRIELEDLLGRASVYLDVRTLSELFAGQTVLVTGAGGSIGSELCRQIARLGVARLVCVDVSEFAVYRLEQELRQAHPQLQTLYYTANVREPERVLAIAQRHPPAVILHAAAYKHVPLMEELNEVEALRTNVLGTLHMARVAGRCGAKRFVLVSTDKAVNPTNVMGASKRLAEQVVQAMALEFPGTHYLSVRFGNVLGSSGSVVPLFTEQIARGGPVTVTHPEIVRYFMTIPEAAQLVLQAGLMGESGQIFVLDMGEPVKIVDLARMMIRLSGKTEQDIPIAFTGLRPGEKLFEELLANDETTAATPHPKLRVVRVGSGNLSADAVNSWIQQLGAMPDPAEVRAKLLLWVPEYTPRGM